jgi:hypothetical protein
MDGSPARKRTKNINLRCFYVKDKIDSGDIVIRYCNTENKRADFFTKALQGSQFRKHRDFIMNIDPTIYNADPRSALKSNGQTDENKLGGQTVEDRRLYVTALLEGKHMNKQGMID